LRAPVAGLQSRKTATAAQSAIVCTITVADCSSLTHFLHALQESCPMIRRAFTMRLKPDAAAEYKHHHDNIWPELVAEIEFAGWTADGMVRQASC